MTWEPQDIYTSSEYSDVNFDAGLPVFFSQKDGIMFATCVNADNDISIDPVTFITHDGGETWSINSIDESDKCFSWSIKRHASSISQFKIIYKKKIWLSNDGVM